MRIVSLSSGSKGNATYIECGNKKILIDIGNSCKYIVSSLESIGVRGEDIDYIFITHTHSDHIGGLKVFLNKYNPVVYLSSIMLDELEYVNNYRFIEDIIEIEDIVIESFKTSHDASDSYGYVVNHDSKSMVLVTDTGYIREKQFNLLRNRDVYLFESNHDIEMLNNGRYSFNLRKRILGDKGHLSNYDSSMYLSKFIGDKTKYIMLLHLSHDNNTKELAYKTLVDRLEEENILFSNILIADQDVISEEVII